MDRKGQGSLEYLLIIGGAVLVAAVVLAIVTNLTTGGGNKINIERLNAICASQPQTQCALVDPDGLGASVPASCRWSATLTRCMGCLNSVVAPVACVPAVP